MEEVLDAVGEAVACLEVVDSVFPDYRFRLEDNTADGSSAAASSWAHHSGAVHALDRISVVLIHNGAEVGTATGSAASGHPALGVVWLVPAELTRRGRDDSCRRSSSPVASLGRWLSNPATRIEAVFDSETRVATHRPPR